MTTPRIDPDFKVPSMYKVCRGIRCRELPIADMLRHRYQHNSRVQSWWAYCAKDLAIYNREVRDGQVWWKGTEEKV